MITLANGSQIMAKGIYSASLLPLLFLVMEPLFRQVSFPYKPWLKESIRLSHLSEPWILDYGASDHIFGNKDLFSSLTITSPLPMITLANGSQTMAKGIYSASLLPSIPLTSVLHVPDSPFNLLSNSKLTCDLNYLITFPDNSVTLQDRSTGRTIGIGREFQGLFHLSSSSSSTACTSIETPLLTHSRLGHPNISKFRVMASFF